MNSNFDLSRKEFLMMRSLTVLIGILLVGCGGSSDVSPSGLQGGGTINTGNLPFLLLVESGQVEPSGENLELILVPKGESVLLGESGEGGEFSLDDFLALLNSADSGSLDARLEYTTGDATSVRHFKILDARRENDGTVKINGQAVATSTAGPQENILAQTTPGFSVLVTDTQNDRLPGALVSAVHEPSGTVYNAVTREDGTARIFNARVGGPYHVSCEMSGFVSQTQSDIYLKPGQTQFLVFHLKESRIPETLSGGRLLVTPSES